MIYRYDFYMDVVNWYLGVFVKIDNVDRLLV